MNDAPGARIDGRSSFRDAVVALATAPDAQRGPAQWWWCDPDFADWPLDDPALITALAAWLERPGRELTLLACGFDGLVRRHPRFVAWRRYMAHRVLGREVAVDASQMPTLFVARPPHAVELLDRVHWRGVKVDDADDWRQRRELVDALMQQSSPSFAATTLGL